MSDTKTCVENGVKQAELQNSIDLADLENLLGVNEPPELVLKEETDLFIDTTTPLNEHFQGTFKKSFAFYTMKERIPVILTKIIDYLARECSTIKANHNASEDEIKMAIKYITKLKNEVTTNKKFTLLKEKSNEAEKWNEYIKRADPPHYFTCLWIFSECYVYRRLREPFVLSKTLKNFDPFGYQKVQAFEDSIQQMCMVANKLNELVMETSKDKMKQNFITLLKDKPYVFHFNGRRSLTAVALTLHRQLSEVKKKSERFLTYMLCLWSNKQDLSLSLGSSVSVAADPIQSVIDLNRQLLADDTERAVDAVYGSVEKVLQRHGCNETSELESGKLVFDLVCDNAGFEVFSDLCLAHFLVHMKIVQKVRFHVKPIPWFVSDAVPIDVRNVIEGCATAKFSKELPSTVHLTSEHLNKLGTKWQHYFTDGIFLMESDDFWTSPCLYKDMKTIDRRLYEKLEAAVAVLFKGDLNYRKLMGEKNWDPATEFETGLQGFHPAPIIAARTVKCELVCGLPTEAVKFANEIDPKWMESGEFGVLQFSSKCDRRHQTV